MSTKWWSCRRNASNRSSKDAKPRGSPVGSADPLSRARVDPVVERDLEDLGRIQVAGEDVRLPAEAAGLDAAAGAALPRVLDGLACAHLLGHDSVRVEHGRVPVPLADDAAGRLEEGLRAAARELDVALRLQQRQLAHDVEQQVRHLVHAVAAVGPQAADVDVGEVVVGAALRRGHPDLGRRGVIVELDPEALQQLFRLLARAAGLEEPAVERLEVLVEAAGVHRVPAVELRDRAEVHEPVHLQRLVQVAGRAGGDAPAHLGDAAEVRAPARVALRGRHALGQLRMALGVADGRVAGDGHRLELVPLEQGLRIREIVEGGDLLLYRFLEVQQAPLVDLAVERGVAGRSLLHELGEHPRAVGVEPVLRQDREGAIAHRAAPPVRDDPVAVSRNRLVAHGVAGLLARAQDLEVLDAVAGELGVGRARLGRRPAFPDDQLVVADVHGLALAEVLEREGAEDGHGMPALVFAVEVGDELGALGADRRRGLGASPAQSLDAFGHGSLLAAVTKATRARPACQRERPGQRGWTRRRASGTNTLTINIRARGARGRLDLWPRTRDCSSTKCTAAWSAA